MDYPHPIDAKCPMCGKLNELRPLYLAYKPYDTPFVITCDKETGGCDRWFVVKIKLTPQVKTAAFDM